MELRALQQKLQKLMKSTTMHENTCLNAMRQYTNVLKNIYTIQVYHRSTRISHPPERYGFLHEYEQELFAYEETGHGDDPLMYEESILDIDSSKWIEAMKSEMDSMYKKQF